LLIIKYALLLVVYMLLVCGNALAAEPLEILGGMAPAYARVQDYTATFIKQERVKGEVLPEERIQYKFKKVFMVYMKWLPGPHKGREALYVQGRNNNKIVGHEGGFVGFVTVNMVPTGSLAMKGNRHPITDSGIGRLIEIIMADIKIASDRGWKDAKVALAGAENVAGRKAWHITAQTTGKGYYAGKLDVWVDAEYGLPVKVKVFGLNGEFLESYTYSDLKLNPGLSDKEFDRDYKDYKF
jgi:outer membrane lipoprotein-sorting protein